MTGRPGVQANRDGTTVKRRARILMAASLGVTGATWPTALAYVLLRWVLRHDDVAWGLAKWLVPLNALVALAVSGLWTRRPPSEPMSLYVWGIGLGTLCGTCWMTAVGVSSGGALQGSWRMVLGGLLYGAPVGMTVGMLLGAEMALYDKWTEAREGRRGVWSPALYVALNLLAAWGILALCS